jgi:hypothetical protein
MMLATPMLLHAMLITSHSSSWQGYLEHHEAMLLKLVGSAPLNYFPSSEVFSLTSVLGDEASLLLIGTVERYL